VTSTFTALPLDSGESFLLRTEARGREFVILVDSGKKYAGKKHPLHKVITEHAPDLERIDIAICTHQDIDHANGFRNFADEWYADGGMIGEYWLPGRWASAAKSIAIDDDNFSQRVLSGALEFADEYFELSETYHPDSSENRQTPFKRKSFTGIREMAIRHEISKALTAKENNEDDFVAHDLDRESSGREELLANSLGLTTDQLYSRLSEIEETSPLNERLPYPLFPMNSSLTFHPRWFDGTVSHKVSTAYNEAIDTAVSIRRIVTSAMKHTIPIRWFDFGLFEDNDNASGGIEDVLVPVNAVELKGPPPEPVSNIALFYSLTLSRQNVESLIFYRPEAKVEPGVLFLGDSRLAYGISKPSRDFPISIKPPNRSIIITSPHHGSRVNDHAYKVIDKWIPNDSEEPYYIRNGGQTGQKLRNYLKQSKRRCAQCVQCNGKNWKQLVTLTTSNSDWDWNNVVGAHCGAPKQ